jgi:hypothetical protein
MSLVVVVLIVVVIPVVVVVVNIIGYVHNRVYGGQEKP